MATRKSSPSALRQSTTPQLLQLQIQEPPRQLRLLFELIDAATAAEFLEITTTTLAMWLKAGCGPEVVLVDGLPHYRRSDLLVIAGLKTAPKLTEQAEVILRRQVEERRRARRRVLP